ncbi:MAG TPA: hypothetical protein VE735_09635 [Gammaproteobacteria bacterium]|nr:hypothetical protein [Gammaproteobacteria bacterium]
MLPGFYAVGVTSDDSWAFVQAIRGVGHVCHLQALGDNAKALFRFDPVTFDRNDQIWLSRKRGRNDRGPWYRVYPQS